MPRSCGLTAHSCTLQQFPDVASRWIVLSSIARRSILPTMACATDDSTMPSSNAQSFVGNNVGLAVLFITRSEDRPTIEPSSSSLVLLVSAGTQHGFLLEAGRNDHAGLIFLTIGLRPLSTLSLISLPSTPPRPNMWGVAAPSLNAGLGP